MPNKTVIILDRRQVQRQVKELDQSMIDGFLAGLQRVQRDKPKPEDLKDLRKWFADYPELWRVVFDLAEFLRDRIAGCIISGEAARIALDANMAAIRSGLGYDDAPTLEKLLIENIVIAWLRNQWAECQMAASMHKREISMPVLEYWDRRSSVAQSRYLSAFETLARVRRLGAKHSNLQVNIATQSGQQVNVSGDLKK
jgi:hypothetical protein